MRASGATPAPGYSGAGRHDRDRRRCRRGCHATGRLPWIASHPERISAFLAERLHQPVRIDQVDRALGAQRATVDLEGVHIGNRRSRASRRC